MKKPVITYKTVLLCFWLVAFAAIVYHVYTIRELNQSINQRDEIIIKIFDRWEEILNERKNNYLYEYFPENWR